MHGFAQAVCSADRNESLQLANSACGLDLPAQSPAGTDLVTPHHSVTAVLTSCARYDLLERTLDSFYKHNTFPIERMIVVEDGDSIPDHIQARYAERSI